RKPLKNPDHRALGSPFDVISQETLHLGFESFCPVFQCIADLSKVKPLARNAPIFPKTETSDFCSCWFLSVYARDHFHYAILKASA
ncbi:MAG: hypothetical protein ACRED2_02600, partial [Methylocella sp.]